MKVDLQGKVALVTGGTRGLGRAIAEGLAHSGADVIVSSRKADACAQVAAEIAEATGRRTLGVACHVGNWADLDALVETAYAEFGHVDVLVNNAGNSPLYPSLDEVSEELFDKTIAVNLKGPFRLCAAIGTRMAAGDGGSIVNISSTGSQRSQPQFVPYAAAKAGVNSMTVGFAHAFGPSVRVNTVMPGPFATEITAGWDWERVNKRLEGFALRRIGQPHEIVGAVLYLASDASSYTTGVVLPVDGGER
ncbi:MAG: SDR family NAD(P)-dependent oxidoreductase [Acidimicrobiia bacterium]